jgi:transcriptional regulator with XRE-family HTH domain
MDTAHIAMGTTRYITPLKLAFLQSEITQREVAEAVGLSEGQLSRIANGLHTSQRNRQAIADALGRQVSDLWPELQRAA